MCYKVNAIYSNASRIPPGLYTMPGYLDRQVSVKTCIVCYLSRHNVPMPVCIRDVGMTRCGDILDEPLSKNAVAAQIVVPNQNSKEVIAVTYS